MKLIIAFVFTAFGVWLALNHPQVAQTVLDYAFLAWEYITEFIGQLT